MPRRRMSYARAGPPRRATRIHQARIRRRSTFPKAGDPDHAKCFPPTRWCQFDSTATGHNQAGGFQFEGQVHRALAGNSHGPGKTLLGRRDFGELAVVKVLQCVLDLFSPGHVAKTVHQPEKAARGQIKPTSRPTISAEAATPPMFLTPADVWDFSEGKPAHRREPPQTLCCNQI